MATKTHYRNAAYWQRVKQDESRLAHYRARRARNQRFRRVRLSAIPPQPQPSASASQGEPDFLSWLFDELASRLAPK
jgi:hypothetical protein